MSGFPQDSLNINKDIYYWIQLSIQMLRVTWRKARQWVGALTYPCSFSPSGPVYSTQGAPFIPLSSQVPHKPRRGMVWQFYRKTIWWRLYLYMLHFIPDKHVALGRYSRTRVLAGFSEAGFNCWQQLGLLPRVFPGTDRIKLVQTTQIIYFWSLTGK